MSRIQIINQSIRRLVPRINQSVRFWFAGVEGQPHRRIISRQECHLPCNPSQSNNLAHLSPLDLRRLPLKRRKPLMKETPHPPTTLGKRVDETLRSMPVVRVVYEMFKHPSKEGDFLLIVCSTIVMVAFLWVQLDGPYDTDGWFLLASGKQIVDNELPYVNPWAYDGSYNVVIQQWLHATLLYLVYSAAGYPGVDLFAAFIAAATFVVMYATSWKLAKGAAPASCFAACAVAVVGCSYYMSVRPTMWTMMALCAVTCVCATSRQSENKKLYLFLPAIMLVHAQLHMSMMWLDVFAAACFLLPWDAIERQQLKGSLKAYLKEKLPLILAILGMAIASCINPYGIDGALYLFNSYGAAGYRSTINELGNILNPNVGYLVWGAFILFAALPTGFMLAERRLAPLPFLVLWIVSLAAFVLHVRNIWIAGISMMIITSTFLAEATPDRLAPPKPALPLLGAAIACGMLAYTAATADQNPDYTVKNHENNAVGWQQVEHDITPIANRILEDDQQGRVYVSWECINSCLEWKGVKVVFDTRPEIWEAGIAKTDVHAWRDFVDSTMDDAALDSYIRDNHWDWYIVPRFLMDRYCENYNLQVELDNGMYVLLRNAD